ncbi:myelin-associated glycoprotein-like isoform X1 [Scomber scombrus]|uniref:Myelin-associated glycoprotein-like isoform X1 n=1 Tax=Scomber scombrus TaxID=13677 RepID=A0AAV1NQ91_SCOSC
MAALVLFFIFLKVNQAQASSQWTADVPSKVRGLPGSCVVIPCSYTYPDPGKTITQFTSSWQDDNNKLIYHPVASKIMEQYRGRTKQLGDVKQNCSLKIDPLHQSDIGPFHFRIEIKGYEYYSYHQNKVSITMISELNPISFSVVEEVEEGVSVSASCSVSHSCPDSPPVFTWSHSGQEHFQSQQLDDGQWQATSTLTFQPSRADNNKPLQCNVTYKGGKHQNTSKVLKVQYAPVNVKVEYQLNVKEGEAVRLKCTSDARPASSFEWHNATGTQVHKEDIYMLKNVSRHTGALYCVATNTMGQGRSSPVQLNVSYAPEIKTISSCSSDGDMMKCMCIVESNPPSRVHFLLSDRVLQSTKLEIHGHLTIGTLQANLGSFGFIQCVANNMMGNANITLISTLPDKNKMLIPYLAIAGGAVLILMILIAVGVFKKCRGRSEDVSSSQMHTIEVPQYAGTPRKKQCHDDVQYPSNDHIYGNMESEWATDDDAIYANT